MKERASGKMEVLVENPMLPPYRVEFFKQLAASAVIDPSFSFGLAHEATSLVDVQEGHGLSVLPVDNVYVRGQMVTYQRGLIKHLRSRRWDAMVASFDPRLVVNLAAMVVARWQGTKFIWWGHGVRPRQRFQRIYRFLASQADAVILYSGEGKRKLEALGVPSDKLFVAWNSIDTSKIARLRSNEWSGRHRLIYIGRLIPAKKVGLLIEGFAKAMTRIDPCIRLTIVGEGPEGEALRQKSGELGVDSRIDWMGAIYDEEGLAPLFNESLLCATGGFVGLNVIHGLAYGVPKLFAVGEPHAPEIEVVGEGDCSATFQSDDSDSLADALAELVADPSRLSRMGAKGADLVSKTFGVERMVAAFEEALEYACRPRGVA